MYFSASSRGGVNIRAQTISGAVIGCSNVSVNYHYHNSPARKLCHTSQSIGSEAKECWT